MFLSRFQGRIRTQMLFGMLMLFVVVSILALSSFQGVAKFRKLTRSIRTRATELPLAAELNQHVCDLRVALYRYRSRKTEIDNSNFASPTGESDRLWLAQQFTDETSAVENALKGYQKQLRLGGAADPRIGDTHLEIETVLKIEESLVKIKKLWELEDYVLGNLPGDSIDHELAQLQIDASQLPGFMKERMDAFHEESRQEYHTWMTVSGISTFLAVLLILLLFERFRACLFKPLQILLNGSRIVAEGNFNHRIELKRKDEVAELAEAMNAMTRNFCQIRDDLDHQVQTRTKEIVRSEQLASVGFLAAGVAHEINNPLASIAWSAESLESRLREILPLSVDNNSDSNTSEGSDEEDNESAAYDDEDLEILERYLRRIQEEAFRCKGITDSLLDFSRLGDTEKHATDLNELVSGVIEMLQHLGKYRRKTISFQPGRAVVAMVNSQEIKQVVLNLITNAMDSLGEDGSVEVSLENHQGMAFIRVKDDGCGMTEEVLQHLFEPFFTRRRDGSGTGLGLSITYQIIADHGGAIEPGSDGVGRGSTFKITLPLVQHEKENQRLQAA